MIFHRPLGFDPQNSHCAFLLSIEFFATGNEIGRIETATCANQDPLHATTGLVPLMGIDVWEHAYYVE